jgi:SAM-dependent methyltransferase
MREEWAARFAERAREYWTVARTRELIGDKRPAILPGEAPALLRALGLLHRDGSMPPAQVRKYRQINHMIAVLQPSFRGLCARFPTVRILDAACGRSYLSTLLAWHFRHNWQHPVQILGVDRNPALVDESSRRAAQVGLDDVLRFVPGSLADFDVERAWAATYGESGGELHGLLSLHGCDTATDDALALGINQGAESIAVVPCCQAELASGWAALVTEGAPFSPLWGAPHLRRATAAHMTDAFRLLLLRSAGYEASAIEFVSPEHTPKNTLIRGLRRSAADSTARVQYEALKEATGGVGIRLEQLLAQ